MSTEAYRKRKRDWAKTESQRIYRRDYMRKWSSENRERANEIARKSHKKNSYKHVLKRREDHLKKSYNLTIEDYNNLLVKQNNKCYICGKLHECLKKGLHVDHNHETGSIRGLLCSKCNGALGWYEKNKMVITEYLNKDIVY